MYRTIEEQEVQPARKQVGEEILRDLGALRGEMEAGSTYNLWYNKWTGHRNTISEPAQYKMDPVRDVGRTKGSADKSSSICVFFARGCCPHGSLCRFWHRLPCEEDREEVPYDVFGRERHAEFRDDMGGTGAFGRENKTLYIGRIASYPDVEEVITRHFSPFGKIAKINVLKSKGVAFIEYTRRIYSEFAKEAMANQKLDRKEILNVRWATEDPNPGSADDTRRDAELLVQKALAEIYPSEYALPAEFRQSQEENLNDSDSLSQNNKRVRLEASSDNQIINHNSNQQPNSSTPNHSESTNKSKLSLISPEVLQSLGYLSQQISYTRSHLKKNSTPSKTVPKVSTQSVISTLVENYSDSDDS